MMVIETYRGRVTDIVPSLRSTSRTERVHLLRLFRKRYNELDSERRTRKSKEKHDSIRTRLGYWKEYCVNGSGDGPKVGVEAGGAVVV